MNKHVKISIRVGLLFCIFVIVIFLVGTGRLTPNLLWGIMPGLISGVGMALFFWIANRITKRHYGSGSERVRQRVKIIIHCPTSEVFTACSNALLAIRKVKIKKDLQSKTEITAKVGMSWKSFGEKITISLESKTAHQTLVTITSEPVLSTTLVDYGKNFENTELICRALKQRLGIIGIERVGA